MDANTLSTIYDAHACTVFARTMRVYVVILSVLVFVTIMNMYLPPPFPSRPPGPLKIFFVKTHKTGSSTVFNILMRLMRGRRIVRAPQAGSGYFTFDGKPLTTDRLILAPNTTYDLFPHHCVYGFDDSAMEIAMFGEIPFRMTILREPASTIKSSVSYFHIFAKYSTLDEVREAMFPAPKNTWALVEKARNGMANGLGYVDGDDVGEFIRSLDSNVDLVMIMELFDESLLVFRHMLAQRGHHLDFRDLVYVAKNQNGGQTSKERVSVAGWADVDIALYDHFYRRLTAYIDTVYGKERMENDLRRFRYYNRAVSDSCFDGVITDERVLRRDFKVYYPHKRFRASLPRVKSPGPQLCVDMALPQLMLEVKYIG